MTITRKYFGTDGVRGKVGMPPVTPELILKLGWAAGRVFSRHGDGKVLIGKDTRISGYMLESVLEAGFIAAGMGVILSGPLPTPAIAYLTRTQRARAGIVISASHNPYSDNGVKFFSSEGTKLSDELELAIEEELEKPLITVDSAKLGKAVRMEDAAGRYIEFCKSTVPSSVTLHGMKIVVDCANGATYHIAPHVFTELGAEVIELSVNPDGFNINQHCGSTDPALLQRLVVAEEADLGIALDGDGDRLMMVDCHGNLLDGDDILYIIAKYRLSQQYPHTGVVGTIMSNMGLELALRQQGIDFIRTRVGDRYVMHELQQQGWWLGGEPSGHVVWLPVSTTGDGIISALQVLAAMVAGQKTLHALLGEFHKFPQVMKNIALPVGANPLQLPIVTQAVHEAEKTLAHQGRVVLRASGTEPVLRVMVEGEDAQQVKIIAEQLVGIISRAVQAS